MFAVICKIGFSATICWNPKGLGKTYFKEESLIETNTFLIKNYYFTIGLWCSNMESL